MRPRFYLGFRSVAFALATLESWATSLGLSRIGVHPRPNVTFVRSFLCLVVFVAYAQEGEINLERTSLMLDGSWVTPVNALHLVEPCTLCRREADFIRRT